MRCACGVRVFVEGVLCCLLTASHPTYPLPQERGFSCYPGAWHHTILIFFFCFDDVTDEWTQADAVLGLTMLNFVVYIVGFQ